MKDLVVRLAALDPDAGAALRVIAYFDQLMDSRAGLRSIVHGAAVLAGCPARLVDDGRRVHVRVGPDGRQAEVTGLPDPSWLSMPVEPDGRAVLWLERTGPRVPLRRWCWSAPPPQHARCWNGGAAAPRPHPTTRRWRC